MSYEIHENDSGWELIDGSGNTVKTGDYPLTTPDDIIDAILDDLGVGAPQKEAFRVLFKQDWVIKDMR